MTDTDITTETEAATALVRSQNDAFRKNPVGDIPGTILVAGELAQAGAATHASLFARVRAFDSFTEENDPYGEHDFGSLEHDGETVFWKIDYYDNDRQYHSPDKTDPKQTYRVLTIYYARDH